MENLIFITDKISYLPSTENPLSAEVVFIKTEECTWIFDTGSSDAAYQEIEKIQGKKNIVISHFHQDHIKNLSRISYDNLYAGANTLKEYNCIPVSEKMIFNADKEDCVVIEPIVCSHAKGSLLLCFDKNAFLGDAIYVTEKHNRPCYNAQKLKDEIDFLKKLDVKYIGVSHARKFLRPKQTVISLLEMIYAKRDGNNPWIWMDKY